jgi:hypothetical protein
VPDVTNIKSEVLPELNWASRLGASSLPSVSFPGTSVPAAGPFAALLTCPGAHPLPRVRDKVAVLIASAQQDAVTALLGQTNIHNYMTGVSAVGEGASGPPRDREPV